MKKAHYGYKLKVGDVVMIKNWMKNNNQTVTRITKKYAICDGDSYIYRFPIEYSIQFTALPRERWDTNEYAVLIDD